jgi:hypothetical protein
MIKSGDQIRVYDQDLAKQKSFFAGHVNDQAMEFDPYISGYAFIIWTKLPTWFEQEYPGFKALTQKNFTAFDGLENMSLQVESYENSFNGNNHQVASTITKSNEDFSITHKEFSGSPIKNGYQYWISSIRDPRTGIATYPKMYNMEYASKNHTGELLYVVTRPDANNTSHRNIEFAAYYTNVLPHDIQLSHYNFSLGDHTAADYNQNFSGTLNIGAHVDNYAKELLDSTYSFVAQGMFDPKNSDVAGNDLSVFNTQDTGITGTGLGDI